jgi:hypothetical protein
MKEERITIKKADELLQFLPLFDKKGRKFVEYYPKAEITDDGKLLLPYPEYPDKEVKGL